VALSLQVDVAGTTTAVGDGIGAVTPVGPMASLVVFAAAGVLFIAYGFLYLPAKEG